MPRTVRKLRNQALFREVNEQIAALNADAEPSEPSPAFVCECRELGCTTMIRVPLEDYNLIRDDPASFVVAHGHEDPEREAVLTRRGSYVVVRMMEALDERAPGAEPADSMPARR